MMVDLDPVVYIFKYAIGSLESFRIFSMSLCESMVIIMESV